MLYEVITVGPFLEHSRIFRFGSDARGPRYFIGSSDLMKRNLDSRVEVMIPVEDPQLVERLREILDACLADDQLAWELESSGTWRRVRGSNSLNAQLHLLERGAASDRYGVRLDSPGRGCGGSAQAGPGGHSGDRKGATRAAG